MQKTHPIHAYIVCSAFRMCEARAADFGENDGLLISPKSSCAACFLALFLHVLTMGQWGHMLAQRL